MTKPETEAFINELRELMKKYGLDMCYATCYCSVRFTGKDKLIDWDELTLSDVIGLIE